MRKNLRVLMRLFAKKADNRFQRHDLSIKDPLVFLSVGLGKTIHGKCWETL